MNEVTVVIPAYNEERRIGNTLAAVIEAGFASEIIVVDDGSTDKTAQVARMPGVRVYTLSPNRGKGGALNFASGLVGTPLVMFLDADLEGAAGEGKLLLAPLLDGSADLTIAKFPPASRKGGFGAVKGLARRGIERYGGTCTEAPLSGQRAMKTEVMRRLLPFYSGYGIEIGMTIRALKLGYKVVEVPTTMKHAETGRDLAGFLHRGRQFWDVARVLLAER